MTAQVKSQIVESIEAAMSLFKTADTDMFDIQQVVRAGKNVNRIEVIFMEYMATVMDMDVLYAEEFKSYHRPHYEESVKYAKLNEETTPSVLRFEAENPIQDCIVHNPNGSQSWPDILVIKDNVGYPLEIKTSSSVPKMNSGIFRLNTPYVAIKKDADPDKRVMRLVMGHEMVSADQIVKWRETIDQVNETVKLLNAPEYRRCYDVFFSAEDWFPNNSVDKHKASVLNYVNS